MTQLDQLKRHSVVVADTGNFESIAQFSPRDATTNPTLILRAAKSPQYRSVLRKALSCDAGRSIDDAMDAVLVQFGLEILKHVSGRVSSEVDARLSFDTGATVYRARQIFNRYRSAGISGDRVLIKIAATWEGIQAAKILANEGIRTNLTLVFNLSQAVACAEAKVQLISPFVGRIYDWYKKSMAEQWDSARMSGSNDPGVQSVRQIYQFYKKHGIKTEIMAASFRSVEQVISLAGCDLLTISPALLEAMQATEQEVVGTLDGGDSAIPALPWVALTESHFRLQMNRDAMATEKLAEGIRLFEEDTLALEALVTEILAEKSA